MNEFSLQIDESTLPDNSALLMAFVRFLDADDICQEMLLALKLATDTTGESIFKKVEAYFEENSIPFKNVVACATDGAASMVGKYRGFNAHLKKAVPNVVCIHCVVHRQHLVAKNLGERLHEALGHVIKAVNLIKKVHCKIASSSACVKRMMKNLNVFYCTSRSGGCRRATAYVVLLHFGTVLSRS